jgi:hypothetical protein
VADDLRRAPCILIFARLGGRLGLTHGRRGSLRRYRRWSSRPGGGKRRRESNASLFILVQIQAGPPAFAGFASYGWAGHAPVSRSEASEGCPAIARRATAGFIRFRCYAASAGQANLWFDARKRACPAVTHRAKAGCNEGCAAIAARAETAAARAPRSFASVVCQWPHSNGRNCRLIGALRAFRGYGICSKDHPARKGNLALRVKGRAICAPFFCALISQDRNS